MIDDRPVVPRYLPVTGLVNAADSICLVALTLAADDQYQQKQRGIAVLGQFSVTMCNQ